MLRSERSDRWDSRGIIGLLPETLTVDLAQFIGIMVGDGHVGIYKRKNKPRSDYYLEISGHINDQEYHLKYIHNLAYSLFNIKFRTRIIPQKHIIILRENSRGLCQFFRQCIGIPNKKDHISIPQCILKSNRQIKASFLRGLADSDFCFTVRYKPNIYPLVHGTSKSKVLINQCSQILNEFGIKSSCCTEEFYYEKRDKTYVIHRVYINGFSRVKLFMEKIGFQNPNKIKKYEEALKQRNFNGIKYTPQCYLS